MSGHNKWSKIKHKKATEDAKKSREFGKFSRLLTLESKKTKGDTNSPELRSVIERARSINMPTTNIDRAIKKGLEKDTASFEEVMYEAYGPGGSALIITGLTDNKNRTAAEIKHLLSKHGASIAIQGAALWAFKKHRDIWTAQSTISLGDMDRKKLEVIIEELKNNDDVQGIYTNVN